MENGKINAMKKDIPEADDDIYDLVCEFMWRTDFNINGIPYINDEEIIYHYTSPYGLKGIINNKLSLWFTKAECLNDYSEGAEIFRIYQGECKKLLEEGTIDGDFYEVIKDIQPEETQNFSYIIPNGIRGQNSKREVYLCSFSKNRDSLPMWNYYVKNDKMQGYNIGVQVGEIRDCLNHLSEKQSFRYSIVPVAYDETTKQRIISDIILEAYRIKFSSIEHLQFGIACRLRNIRYNMKNYCYRHEEEIRIIVELPEDYPKESCEEKIIIHNRKVQEMDVPYIELEFKKNALRTIFISPLMKFKEEYEMLNANLRDNQYENVEIYKSDIPIRY